MDTLPRLLVSRSRQSVDEGKGTLKKADEEEEELFKDLDPKTLAAVLLESLNHSQLAEKREEEEQKEDVKVETGKDDKEHVSQEVPMMERADRDRQLELELFLAAQGKEQDRQKEEELKKAQEEEEKVTEKVTSHTTSQDIQVEQLPKGLEEGEDNQQALSPREGPNSNEEEEQLSPEELKSLETMMQVFPRLNTVTKRDESPEQNERDSRDYNSYNDVIPLNKGNNMAMMKKKLKWQEETQKALNFPMFESNFMDEFEKNNYGKTGQSQSSAEQESLADDEPEENDNEEDEDALSPEEEEAQAKAEQEEMRRQAAEAQRAKMEEEKLADIASDMLLRYMGKQGNGNRKHGSNAVEDKRSDEEQDAAEENDIDLQTIDKLIEISSKLHLPADDVVDIISDVEKKKKKDMPSGVTSHQQSNILSPSFSAKHAFSATPISTDQKPPPISKLHSPAFNPQLKPWFRDKPLSKSAHLWDNLPKPLLANRNQAKSLNPLKQEFWIKSLKPRYSFYPYTYYQRNSYPAYPYYFPPPPRPKPRFYIPKSSQSSNNYNGNFQDESYYYFPQKHFYGWVRPPLRNPPNGFQRKPYFSRYPLSMYPWTFQPILRPRSPSRVPVIPPQPKKYYYSASAHPAMAKEDYYVSVNQPDNRNIPLRKPQILDWKVKKRRETENDRHELVSL